MLLVLLFITCAQFFVVFSSLNSICVSQDFFLSTPKHPFFLWLLNDRWEAFTKSNAYPLPTTTDSSETVGHRNSNSNSNSTISVHSSVRRALNTNHTTTHGHKHVHVEDHRPPFAKGPFSYSIEKEIDRYLQYKKDRHTSATDGSGDDAILELHEDLLHSLVDSTNSRLHSNCKAFEGKEGKEAASSGGATLGEYLFTV
mgnify:CR=1 FL=1